MSAGFGIPAPDVEQGPGDRAEERASAGGRRRGARGGHDYAVDGVGERGEPPPPGAPHQGRGRQRRRGEGQVLRHVPAVPAAPDVALLHLQQLRPEVRPPLPLGRPVHRPGQSPIPSFFLCRINVEEVERF